jgi:hypothetical protein
MLQLGNNHNNSPASSKRATHSVLSEGEKAMALKCRTSEEVSGRVVDPIIRLCGRQEEKDRAGVRHGSKGKHENEND